MQYGQFPTQPNQGISGEDEKKSGSRWWIRYVIVPIIVALIGTGVFFGVKSVNPSPPNPTPTVPSPTIPVLHSTYTGTFTDLATRQVFTFSISDLAEDTNTGDFTAAAVDGFCAAQITNGMVNTSGHITFKLQQEFNQNNNCGTVVTDFTGQVNSSGGISGQWEEENTQFNGTFTLS